jgi:hypothetical protein
MRITSGVALAALVTACAASPRYEYRPTRDTALEDAPGDVDGHAAADYRVPKIVPRGDVQVATLGVATTRLPDGGGARTGRALHVRMKVHNGSGEPWEVDASDQRATINRTLHLQPALATCDGDVMPLAVLMPGDRRTIDLYYELPPRLVAAATIASVRIDWRVVTPSGVLASDSTAFERHDVPPPPPRAPPDPKKMVKRLAQSRPEWPSWRN